MALDKQSLTAAMDGHLRPAEMNAVLARRDLIVERFSKLAASGATGKHDLDGGDDRQNARRPNVPDLVHHIRD